MEGTAFYFGAEKRGGGGGKKNESFYPHFIEKLEGDGQGAEG